MENPTFRLEGVVKIKDNLEDFEGPLTLILQLLSKNRIEIQDIRIAELLDQYLAYLDEMKAMDLDIASEFVVMASHLVYIKARMLLNAGAENTELEELIESLERLKNRDVYDNIKRVVPLLDAMYVQGAGMLVKPPEYLSADREYRYSHDRADILEALTRVLTRGDAVSVLAAAPAFQMPHRIVYSVTEKTGELLKRLKFCGRERLTDIFMSSGSRTELVATFISLLELCRAGSIFIDGEGDGMYVSCADDA